MDQWIKTLVRAGILSWPKSGHLFNTVGQQWNKTYCNRDQQSTCDHILFVPQPPANAYRNEHVNQYSNEYPGSAKLIPLVTKKPGARGDHEHRAEVIDDRDQIESFSLFRSRNVRLAEDRSVETLIVTPMDKTISIGLRQDTFNSGSLNISSGKTYFC